MFIKELFNKKNPSELQGEFLKFGRGDFRDKYIIEAKTQKDRRTIKTSAEFANLLVKECLEEIRTPEINVTGAIISTINLGSDEELGFKTKGRKNFMGIRQILVDGPVPAKRIIQLMNENPRVFFALSFSTPLSELKVKAKAPKSAKPSGSGDKEAVADFCSIKTANKKIIDELLFDCGEFKEVKVRHTIKIKDIVYPKGESDPIKVRENSRRSGEIVRIIDADGQRSEKVAEFKA